jgi:ATP-dependent DNA helicase RecG
MPHFDPLDRDVKFVKGVGPKRAELLERLGVKTARDLLYHIPRRYEDASTVASIGGLDAGDDATIIGRVVSKGVLPTRKGLKIFQAVIKDRSGYIECSWPGQPFLDRVIQRGDLLLVSGSVKFFHGKQLQPREFITLADEGESAGSGEGVVIPIYPATEGLTHKQIRTLISENLEEMLAAIGSDEVIPDSLLASSGVPRLPDALMMLHKPPTLAAAEQGRRRLALEELFFIQLTHAVAHHKTTRRRPGISFPSGSTMVTSLHRSLPFQLTGAQKRALVEIGADMGSDHRMNRLLQGDVGSGKTIVGLFAALRAIDSGYQVALMAPTEILAEQHARSAQRLLEGLTVTQELLTGKMNGMRKREAQARIADGTAQLVIGTHALFQDAVKFAKLGLAIIDEQHRFGVRQRMALTDLAGRGGAGDSADPDVLVMSATPIPRSLALTLYGDLDISVLDERPANRKPIRSVVRRPAELPKVFEFIREQVRSGSQAYIVYPLVEESEAIDVKAAAEEFERLQAEVFPELRMGLLHGQMPSDEKDRTMQAFARGETDVLVATTVIEVGIDVANATVMVIEHAERFGLSQLHQLRGRIGRGAKESYCVLVSDLAEAAERLRIFVRTDDGFRIAEEDLRLRGQGDLFGARQSGVPAFKWADLEKDLELLNLARESARKIVGDDPELARQQKLKEALEQRFADRAELFRIG